MPVYYYLKKPLINLGGFFTFNPLYLFSYLWCMARLTDKQQRFCDEYLVDFNATRSAIAAGYSKKTACRIGSENLQKLDIIEYLSAKKEKIAERNDITIDECVGILANIVRSDIADLYTKEGIIKNIHDIPKETRTAISALDIDELQVEGKYVGQVSKVKLSDKRASVIELMKYLGGYEVDNKQKTIPIDAIKVEIIKGD